MEQKIPLPNISEPSEMTINPPVNSSSSKKPFLIVLLVILLVVLSSLGTYFFVKSQTASPTPTITPTPTNSTPLIPSTADETANWKTFSSPSIPIEFKYPTSVYSAGKIVQDGTYHVFLSNNPIIIPDSWDSPFTPVEIIFEKNKNLNEPLSQMEGNLTNDSLKKQTINANNINATMVSGIVKQGYFGGEKLSVGYFQLKNDLISVYLYSTVDANFSQALFIQILSTFKFN